MGNLHALRAWYSNVRLQYVDSGDHPLYTAADQELERHVRHRVNELLKIIGKLEDCLSRPAALSEGPSYSEQHRKLIANCEHIKSILLKDEHPNCPINFLAEYETLRNNRSHLGAVRSLTEKSSAEAAGWLLQIAARPHFAMQALFGLPE